MLGHEVDAVLPITKVRVSLDVVIAQRIVETCEKAPRMPTS